MGDATGELRAVVLLLHVEAAERRGLMGPPFRGRLRIAAAEGDERRRRSARRDAPPGGSPRAAAATGGAGTRAFLALPPLRAGGRSMRAAAVATMVAAMAALDPTCPGRGWGCTPGVMPYKQGGAGGNP
eukprot:gene8047-8455_t